MKGNSRKNTESGGETNTQDVDDAPVVEEPFEITSLEREDVRYKGRRHGIALDFPSGVCSHIRDCSSVFIRSRWIKKWCGYGTLILRRYSYLSCCKLL